MEDSRIVAGINGFGRFALNLLWWWFRDTTAPYRIGFINDENLTLKGMLGIIKDDSFVRGFNRCKVSLSGNMLTLQDPDGRTENILLTTCPAENASWVGKPTLFFECSGARSSSARLCKPFLVENTKVVIISATCYDADQVLVMGYNHDEFDTERHKIISYGSCTINPGIVLSSFFNDAFGVEGCVVNVIHNVQKYKLEIGEYHTLQRKHCTLETMAVKMLPFFTRNNFSVNYTVVPWEGASIIDFSFKLKSMPEREKIIDELKTAIGRGGRLEGLIGMISTDTGPEVHIGSAYSAVIVEDAIKLVGDTVHLFCYFFNEGSGVRLHELASFITGKL